MAKNTNPFWTDDFATIMAQFDPNKVVEQFSKTLSDATLPGVNLDAVVESQRKNLEALTKANQAALEGAQELATRQAQILQKTVDELSTAASEIGTLESPQDAAAKQTEMTKQAFETAITNMREMADVVAKSNEQAASAINSRIAEALEEVKSLVLKQK